MSEGTHVCLLAPGQQGGLIDNIGQLSAAEAAGDLCERPTNRAALQLGRDRHLAHAETGFNLCSKRSNIKYIFYNTAGQNMPRSGKPRHRCCDSTTKQIATDMGSAVTEASAKRRHQKVQHPAADGKASIPKS